MRDLLMLGVIMFFMVICLAVLVFFVLEGIKDIRRHRHDEGTIVLLLCSSIMIIVAVWLIVTCIISIV